MFTDRYIKSLEPKKSRYEVREGNGFAIRVFPNGKKTFCYIYDIQGRRRRMTLGPYPGIKLAEARRRHADARALRLQGVDPAAKVATITSMTVAELSEYYLEKYAKPNKKSWHNDAYVIKREIIPTIGDREIQDVTRRDIVLMLEKIVDRGAQRWSTITLTITRRMFGFAVDRGLLDHSPVDGVKAMAADVKKDRWLDDDEIRALWHWLPQSGMSDPVQRAIKAILASGCRCSEVLRMDWSEVNGDWWTIPAARMKNGREHRVHMTPLLRELCGPPGKHGLGFGSATTGKAMLHTSASQALRRAIKKYNKQDDIEPLEFFSPRDLRRTCATHLAKMGVNEHIIGKVLSHTDQSVTGIYNRHAYDAEKQQALSQWAERLREIVDGLVI
ncbi:MAG: tyrosine-type recombinase/integrase [Desulfuromonas sp.]|nr:tyrosine-type recombinase/integrase [Desulfuromonas sp.]